MLAIERKNEILNKLRTEQRVLVSDLAAHYNVTEETIRRDLDKLEKDGYATKTYGGAIWGNITKSDLSYTIRNKTNVEAKNEIAELVSTLIEDGDHLMMDDSSTSLFTARRLKEKKDLTIITNSVGLVVELAGMETWTILSTGGQLKRESLALVGARSLDALRCYHVDKVIFSCKGLDREAGITDSNELNAQSKQVMLSAAKKRILTVCVKLFLEKGYRKTTLAEIIEKADVSYSSFQNIFRAKDGVLTELVAFMFSNQFAAARGTAEAHLPPVFVYAVETAIQMTLTELNENLREIYIEAYTQQEASDFILRETSKELHQIFGSYQPELTARDFYDMEIGSAGIMRGYMAHPCDGELTLEKKLRLFLTMSLRAYHVPADEIERVIGFVAGLDIRAISEKVMQELFQALAMHYEFSLQQIETDPTKKEATT